MYLFYLDESGNTWKDLKNSQQPIHFLTWIGFDSKNIKMIESEINKLRNIFLPFSENKDFEFHWVDIVKWNWYFKNFSLDIRLQLISQMMEIFNKYDMYFFSQWIDKSKHANKYSNPFHPQIVCFMYLIEKINTFLDQNNSVWIVIMDKNSETEHAIIGNFEYYKKNWPNYWYYKNLKISNLIDTVFYSSSIDSSFIQFVDVIWYIFYVVTVSKRTLSETRINDIKLKLLWYYEYIINKTFHFNIKPN